MADVLSQSQIDALLKSMQSGEEPEPEKEEPESNFRTYDFYSPKKFTKDRLKVLKSVYDNYCRLASSQINSLFRVTSEMEVLTVEETRYFEFNNMLSDDDILTLVDIRLPDYVGKIPPMMLHVSPVLMVAMIDRMLGGTGSDRNIDSSYVFTELELPLFRRIMEYLIMGFKDAWSNYVRMEAKINRIEDNPGLYQDIGMNETVVVIMLNVTMQGNTEAINICVPENLMQAIFEVADNRKRSDDDYGNELPDVKRTILDKIKESALTVRAQLANGEMSINDVYSLQVGDVIDFNKPQDSEVRLFVGEQPWFMGQLGVSNKKVAVKINSRFIQEADVEPEIQADSFKSTVK